MVPFFVDALFHLKKSKEDTMKSDIKKMRKAMRLLAAHDRNVQYVADLMHVHRTTIWRWANAPGMRDYYIERVYVELDKIEEKRRIARLSEPPEPEVEYTLEDIQKAGRVLEMAHRYGFPW
jgi:hypothetical protein